MNQENKFVELISVQGELKAKVIKGLLESVGITTRLESTISHSVYPFNVDGLGMVTILVLESDRKIALEVLKKENDSLDDDNIHE